ncbi:MAG: glycosyl hydrolase [Phycisphaerae bacterium]|nr:glycosyl hydrolase [Phycisphaerae bacterium]
MHVAVVVAVMRSGAFVLPVAAADSAALRSQFAGPPRQYSSAPLWVWNDMLTEEQVVSTLRDLAGQNVKQVFVHPRPGLMTPYLSADWFRLWKVALKEAERLDMNVWIYDENSYPSGFAGGFVPDAMPESRGRGLDIKEQQSPLKLDANCVAVLRPAQNGFEDVTKQARAGEDLPSGKYMVASLRWAGTSPWHGGKFYVNLLTPGVTEKFLAITMDAYRRNIGEQFGKRVPGVFTDEPEITPAGGLPWADDLPEVFRKRWNYDLIAHLPSLVQPVGDWKQVRHDYLQVLLELFIDRWAKPYHDYCAKHNLEFTGHYWEHEWPNCLTGPDNMAMYAWHQRPAIDILMNQYSEDVHAQFGNVRAVKELSSVANQLGAARTLCEAYGAGGWDLRFEDMKRIGDWIYVLGVNTLDQHLSYVTIRGARKRDHPQSFSYHEPWWKDYHVMASYFTRLSLIMSQGRQVNRVLVIEPTTTAWMYQGDPKQKEIGDRFQSLLVALERAQVEYDIGCEDILARHGSTQGPNLKVGQASYNTVVLPSLTENLNRPTMDLLDAYLKAQGVVLCCGDAPARVDGRPSDRAETASKQPGWKRVETSEVPTTLLARAADGFAVRSTEDSNKGIVLHHRRMVEDGEFVLVVNTSLDENQLRTITSTAQSVEEWDPRTGKISAFPFSKTDTGISTYCYLPPCGSRLLFLSPKAPVPEKQSARLKGNLVEAKAELEITPLDGNVLTLDYVDVAAGGETKRGIYFYKASQFAFVKNGLPRNPWDSSVQFKDELVTKKFAPDSGFEASYRFTIEERVPERLSIVIERPDLYTITCNGKAVSPKKDAWWLDKAFGQIDIGEAARVGENVVTIQASPFTIYHELEPAYVLGTFRLKPVESGFVVIGESKPTLKLGSWKSQGYPLYSAAISYKYSYDVSQPMGHWAVQTGDWYGSVAEVVVNGKSAGYLISPHWAGLDRLCDVTSFIQSGANTVEVRVIGTLKNTLGPHHNGTLRGSAWPASFQKAPENGPPPGDSYDTIDYGLFEPFTLHQIVEE